MPEDRIVIGLDGGGSYTRVVCANMSGQILARTQTGGANPEKNIDAEQNVQSALNQAIVAAGHAPQQVAGLTAGFAGFDSPEDLAWAERFATIPDLTVAPYCVNDAVVAQAGALCLRPGIVAIAGTGSIVFGVTEAGRRVSDYDFEHHPGATARSLGYEAVFRILAGEATMDDAGLVERILAHFGVADIAALAEQAAGNSRQIYQEIIRVYGNLAPLVTEAANNDIPLARAVCDMAVSGLVLGIRLLGSLFRSDTVLVALIGGVASSGYIQARLTEALELRSERNQGFSENPGFLGANRRYELVEPALSPEAGAVLMALDRLGVAPTETIIDNLSRQPR